jgi:AraC family transcriptional regulator
MSSRPAIDQANLIKVGRVAGWVSLNLDRAIDLDDLASRACLSRFHFARMFRALTGETPAGFVRRLRLERAAWRLRDPNARLIDVALASGFDTPDGFTRAFRARFGVTPTAYRADQPPLNAAPVHGAAFFRPDILTPDPASSPMPITIKPMPEMFYVAARMIGPYTAVGPAFQRVCGWAVEAGVMGPDSQVIGLSHDDPNRLPAEHLRYDAAVVVTRPPGPLPAGLALGALPACHWATLTHQGSYATMPASFHRLFATVAERRDLTPMPLPCMEIYLNTPDHVAAADLLTDLHVAVALQE